MPDRDIEADADPTYTASDASPHEAGPDGPEDSTQVLDGTVPMGGGSNSPTQRIPTTSNLHERPQQSQQNPKTNRDLELEDELRQLLQRFERRQVEEGSHHENLYAQQQLRSILRKNKIPTTKPPTKPAMSADHVNTRRSVRTSDHDMRKPSPPKGLEHGREDSSARTHQDQFSSDSTDSEIELQFPRTNRPVRERTQPEEHLDHVKIGRTNKPHHYGAPASFELYESFPRGDMNDSHRKSFIKRLQTVYKKSVIQIQSGTVQVNFAELNRAVLERAQNRLLRNALDFCYGDERKGAHSLGIAEDYLTDYVTAWKNLEFMTERRMKHYDPFVISTDYAMQRCMLQDAEEEWRNSARGTIEDLKHIASENGLKKLSDKERIAVRRVGGGSRTSDIKRGMIENYIWKIAMAIVGGLFLIVPMLVMVLHPGLVTSLVTTSVCVFAFGLAMCYFLDKPFDVLSGTAAYAAVLVVFIGTSGGT